MYKYVQRVTNTKYTNCILQKAKEPSGNLFRTADGILLIALIAHLYTMQC